MATAAPKKDELALFELEHIAPGTKFEGEYIAIELVELDPEQPRTEPDSDLEHKIKVAGRVLQPLSVRTHTDPAKAAKGFVIIRDGERRYWGAIKAGLKTLPVIKDDTKDSRLQRLVRQAMFNAHRPLPPLDEARMFVEIKEATGWSEETMAEKLGYKKSTIADRLAIANMPECWLPHFTGETPLLSSSAAAVLRKYFGVPANILELSARTAPADPEWERAKKAGKPVDLKDVERVLRQIILVDRMRELPESLVLTYRGLGGVSCKVAGVEYAVDVPKFIAAEKKYVEEQQRADRERVDASRPANHGNAAPFARQTDDDEDDASEPSQQHTGTDDLWDSAPEEEGGAPGSVDRSPSEPAAPRASPPAKPLVSAADRKRIAKENAEKEAAALKLEQWRKARPQMLVAIAAALKIAPADAKHPLGEFVSEEVARAVGTDLDAVLKLVPLGTTAQDLVRHLAMLHLYDDLMSDFNYEGIPRRLRELGLKVDVTKIIESAAKPAAAARSAGTPKRGGRPLTPPAPTKAAKTKPAPKAKASAKKTGRKR